MEAAGGGNAQIIVISDLVVHCGKNGVNFFNIKRLHENWTVRILDTGYWMLEWKKESLVQRRRLRCMSLFFYL